MTEFDKDTGLYVDSRRIINPRGLARPNRLHHSGVTHAVMGKTAAAGASISVVNAWYGHSLLQNTGHINITPSAGNTLVVGVGGYAVAAANDSITSSSGTSWASSEIASLDVGDNYGISLWYLKNIGTETWVQADVGTGGVVSEAFVVEVAGLSTSAPFTTGEKNTSTGAATTAPATGTFNSATANSIFFALIANEYGNTVPAATFTANATGSAPTGWGYGSFTTTLKETDGGNYVPASLAFLIVSATSNNNKHVWTTDSAKYGTIIAALHA